MLVISEPTQEKVDRELRKDRSFESVYDRYASFKQANADGGVVFQWPGEEVALLARAPGLQGFVNVVSHPEGTLDIELWEISEVHVRVEDSSGEPLEGVSVAIESGVVRDWGRHGKSQTSADGHVRFRHFIEGQTWHEPGEPWYGVALDVPGIDRKKRFDPDGVGMEPVVLRLGPTGSVRVRAVDDKGEAIDMTGIASIASTVWAERNTLENPLSDGAAFFQYCGLGERLSVGIKAPELGIDWEVTADGPVTAGETITIDVVAPGRPSLVGRLLEESGEPYASKRLYVIVLSAIREQLQQVEIETSETGHFRVELNEKCVVGSGVVVSALTHRGGWRDRADYGKELSVTPGEMQLGDLTLRDAGATLSGQCVDMAGQPVANLQVSAALEAYQNSHVARTDKQGRFTMNALFAEDVALSLSHRETDWVLVDPKVVPRGSEDLTLRVARGGRIVGAVQVGPDELVPDINFVVYASDHEASGSGWSAYVQVDEADGTFAAEGLESGRYTCKMWRRGMLLNEVRNVEVVVSETTRDPRLQAIDLQGIFQSVEFAIETADGKDVHAQATAVLDGKIADYCGVYGDDRAKLTFPVTPGAMIVVRQPGYRPAVVDAAGEIGTVTLQRGIEVRLITDDRPRMSDGGKSAQLSLVLESEVVAGVDFSAGIRSNLASKGTATVTFPAPGRYRLQVTVSEAFGDGLSTIGEARKLDTVIEVREEDAGMELYVELPDELFPRD